MATRQSLCQTNSSSRFAIKLIFAIFIIGSSIFIQIRYSTQVSSILLTQSSSIEDLWERFPTSTSSSTTRNQGEYSDDEESLYYSWNERGCQEWPNLLQHQREYKRILSTNSTTQQPSLLPPRDESQSRRPTGMVVTLATRQQGKPQAIKLMDLLCQKVPTQQAYYYEPHGWDLLMLIDIYDHTYYDVAKCLQLHDLNIIETWKNMDGSVLTTHKYRSKTYQTFVYLAQYKMQYPHYIQRNMSILEEPMEDCPMPHDYIEGCRYYSDQFLHLSILKNYEYMIKVDLDVEFKAPIPFDQLWDMKLKGSIFAHFGEFPDGMPACTKNIKVVRSNFINTHANYWKANKISFKGYNDDTAGTTTTAMTTSNPSSSSSSSESSAWTKYWKGPCSPGIKEYSRAVDQYYGNMLIFYRPFWQSAPVLSYARYFNEYNPGFFKYRWGDQLFFHIAMGMFLGPECVL